MLQDVSTSECLRAGREAFVRRPLPLILGWAIAAGLVALFVVLFFGPWCTGALMALFVPLKCEEDGYVRRLEERRATMNLPQTQNRAS